MSHGDSIQKLPDGFVTTATTENTPVAAAENQVAATAPGAPGNKLKNHDERRAGRDRQERVGYPVDAVVRFEIA